MKATQQLHDLGQSLWLDNMSRTLLSDGTLSRYISDFSITGLTSNPTIFEQAIAGGAAYDDDIRQKMSNLQKPPSPSLWAEIVNGDRTNKSGMPDEPTIRKQWEDSRTAFPVRTVDPTGKPLHEDVVNSRKEFVDKAQTGKKFTHTEYPASVFEVLEGGKLQSIEASGIRPMKAGVNSFSDEVKPGQVKWQEPSPTEKVSSVEPPKSADPHASYWDKIKQEGKPGKEAMRQTVVDEANKMISASKDAANFSTFADKQDSGKVDAYRGILQESGFEVGPVSYNEKEGTASWSIAQAKPQKRPDRKYNPSEAKSGDIVSQEPKRDQEVKDAPQTMKGGGPNEVQTKDGRQEQTKAEADALSKGQVSSKGEQAAVETPSPASSVPIKSSPTPSRQPSELQSPAEYRATLTKPTIKAIDLTTSQLTDMEIKHDLLEISKVDGTTQRDVFNQERRLSAQLKQLLDCLGK